MYAVCTYSFTRSFHNIEPRMKCIGICQFRFKIFPFTYILPCTLNECVGIYMERIFNLFPLFENLIPTFIH